tara:strand:- start:2733 stop:3272 length:540 start_codon:yes stop_codon:yes gene_type:complete
MTNFEPRNYRVDNVELNWAKLGKPVQPFENDPKTQWELQIATTDKTVADEWAKNHLAIKGIDSAGKTEKNEAFNGTVVKYVANLKRKATKSDGNPNAPVRVVDIAAQPIINGKLSKIGNGSVGNVIVYQFPYEYMGKSGISNSLTAIQVTTLKEFVEAPMFEPISVDMETGDKSAEMPF